jgi:hypothetical protein
MEETRLRADSISQLASVIARSDVKNVAFPAAGELVLPKVDHLFDNLVFSRLPVFLPPIE